MSKVSISGNSLGTGTLTIAAPNTNTDRTLTLPDATGTILTSATTTGFPAGSVLQVVSVIYGTYGTTSSTSFSDTGLSASITPSSTSSKVLIICNLNGVGKGSNAQTSAGGSYKLVDGSGNLITQISNGTGWTGSALYNPALGISISYLHSPNTTSSFTYKVQYASEVSGANATFNWYNSSADTKSSLTLMEIAA